MLLGSVAFAAAKPAYVLTTVNLRAAPGTTSEIVTKIPGGSLIDAEIAPRLVRRHLAGEERLCYPDRARPERPRAARGGPAARLSPGARPPGYRPRGFVVEEPIYYDPPPPIVYYDGPFFAAPLLAARWW